MSKLSFDQKTIRGLLEDKKADFLIPDYQRPYAWEEKECQTLWDDLFMFAFPDEGRGYFDEMKEEYFLGPIVTFRNNQHKLEIIDGQQRLTSIMLLLRAFYAKNDEINDPNAEAAKENIAKSIWKTNVYNKPNKDELKIVSEVAMENEKEEFAFILKTGRVEGEMNSKYAQNYLFFQDKIDDFLHNYPTLFTLFPMRILDNCFLLPIETEDQDTALRIFSTLNDRGKPLSDADIFKAQFYKYYSNKGEKDSFMDKWRELEATSDEIFKPLTGNPMDELFTRYMYFERAKTGVRTSTTEALRKFYEKNNYALLKNDYILDNLSSLADFWKDITEQNAQKFSERILKKLFVLNYAPNSMWTYFVSVYFMQNKTPDGLLDEQNFYNFLNKTIGFVWAYAFTNPGVNALRTPLFTEMINIVNGKNVDFADFKFDKNELEIAIRNYRFLNGRPITKSMLALWAFAREDQQLLVLQDKFEIEHIYAKQRAVKDGVRQMDFIDSLGNKSLLEKGINGSAGDFYFKDKKRLYKFGSTRKPGQTKIADLLYIANNYTQFNKTDIDARNDTMINAFLQFIEDLGLMR